MKDSAIFLDSDLREGIHIEYYDSPIGSLCIGSSETGLRFVKLVSHKTIAETPSSITSEAISQLKAYFSQQLKTFDLPLDLSGYTDFSIRVWQKLLDIPYGKTTTYMKLSLDVGDVKAIRAVGTANGRNPIPIIIPCHRVIGSDGSLTGFALGLDVKKQLLALENPNVFGLSQGTLMF